MKYSISEVSEMTGLSTRTLRYYDEIELLKAHRSAENKYRIYFSEDLDVLQVIMFLRKLEVPLPEIKDLLQSNEADLTHVLVQHKEKLVKKQSELAAVIQLIDITIENKKEGKQMADRKKFEAFKLEKIKDNNEKYGQEVIEKYGRDALENTEQHWSQLSQLEYHQAEECESLVKKGLQKLLEQNHENDISDTEKEVFDAHAKWLKLMSGQYNETYHYALAELYVEDERFTAYYDNLVGKKDAAEMLSNIIKKYAQK